MFNRSVCAFVEQEIMNAVQGVLAKRGLTAKTSGSFSTETFTLKLALMSATPQTVVRSLYNGAAEKVTTEMLRTGQPMTNVEAMVNERGGINYRVRITKRASVKYQYTYLEGPNTGRNFTAPFRMFSAVPENEAVSL